MTGAPRSSRTHPLVICVGNRNRHDDGVGIHMARGLKATLGDDVVEASGEGTALMRAWERADWVILIDSVCSGGAPGTLHHVDASKDCFAPDLLHTSTHAFGVADAIEMARALGTLPRQLVVYGIEGEDFSPGFGLSPRVAAGAAEAALLILNEIQAGTLATEDVNHA